MTIAPGIFGTPMLFGMLKEQCVTVFGDVLRSVTYCFAFAIAQGLSNDSGFKLHQDWIVR
jgi:hypothetical protein